MTTTWCIHMERIGKPPRIFNETQLVDDGVRVDTEVHIPLEWGLPWSKEWWENGMLAEGQVIRLIRKHHFYWEWFGIMEMFDVEERLLGSYCDVLTPVQRVGDDYFLTDLLLDLWVWPDGHFRELDWDEFRAAEEAGLLAADLARQAEATLQRMVEETRAGRFPGIFLPGTML